MARAFHETIELKAVEALDPESPIQGRRERLLLMLSAAFMVVNWSRWCWYVARSR